MQYTFYLLLRSDMNTVFIFLNIQVDQDAKSLLYKTYPVDLIPNCEKRTGVPKFSSLFLETELDTVECSTSNHLRFCISVNLHNES